jgi:hypothetical protein
MATLATPTSEKQSNIRTADGTSFEGVVVFCLLLAGNSSFVMPTTPCLEYAIAFQ